MELNLFWQYHDYEAHVTATLPLIPTQKCSQEKCMKNGTIDIFQILSINS